MARFIFRNRIIQQTPNGFSPPLASPQRTNFLKTTVQAFCIGWRQGIMDDVCTMGIANKSFSNTLFLSKPSFGVVGPAGLDDNGIHASCLKGTDTRPTGSRQRINSSIRHFESEGGISTMFSRPCPRVVECPCTEFVFPFGADVQLFPVGFLDARIQLNWELNFNKVRPTVFIT